MMKYHPTGSGAGLSLRPPRTTVTPHQRSGFDDVLTPRHDYIFMLEGYTTLGYVAGRTETMTLGLLVTGVTYRYPGLLAKIVTTLDVLSGGRAMLGLGAAWYEREHLALGVPFYSIAERLERLEETLQICSQMWSGDDGPYEGKHYRLAETLNVPPSIRQPRPPIMIGGGGERKLLRLVAKYADANNLFPASPEEVQHKLDVLARHCDEVGRDRSEIRNTTIGRVGPTPTSMCSSTGWRHTRRSASSTFSSACSAPSPRSSSSVWCRGSCRASPSSSHSERRTRAGPHWETASPSASPESARPRRQVGTGCGR